MKRLILWLSLMVIYFPILILIVYSFHAGKFTHHWEGFSFHWYVKLFHDPIIQKVLLDTAIIAISSTGLSLILGTLLAYSLFHMRQGSKQFYQALSYIPILNPDLITGIALLLLFSFIKLPLGFVSVILAHTVFNSAYVTSIILPRLENIPESTLSAAQDLGAKPWQIFYWIILPHIHLGLKISTVICLTLSLDDFLISFFTTGNHIQNLSMFIYSTARKGIDPTLSALSSIFFLILTLVFIILVRKKPKKNILKNFYEGDEYV